MATKSNFWGLLAGITAAAIWGGMYVVSKVVLQVVPPFALVASRLLLGASVLLCILLIRGGLHIRRTEFLRLFAVGFVGYGVSLSLQFLGTMLSTASNGALVTSATPAFVLVFAALLLKEKITLRRLASLLIASVGVLAVIDPRAAQLDSTLFLGNLYLLGAALTWALYSVLVRMVTRNSDVLLVSTIALLGGLPVTLPLGLWEIATQRLGEITPGIIGGILFLGVIATALAMFLWNYAFASLPASSASLTFFAQPIVGTLLGWLYLGENITPLFLFGGALIAIGLIIANIEK